MLLRYSAWCSSYRQRHHNTRPVFEGEVATNFFRRLRNERHGCYHFELFSNITKWHKTVGSYTSAVQLAGRNFSSPLDTEW